jgi:hypothetical protein
MTLRTSFWLVALTLTPAAVASAQDPFEIQVYEYVTVPKGRWNLETHFNYTARGTRVMDGSAAPSEGQTHLTLELTRGLTDLFEMAGYLVLASGRATDPILSAGGFAPGSERPRPGGFR